MPTQRRWPSLSEYPSSPLQQGGAAIILRSCALAGLTVGLRVNSRLHKRYFGLGKSLTFSLGAQPASYLRAVPKCLVPASALLADEKPIDGGLVCVAMV